jgi:hypothetical protein
MRVMFDVTDPDEKKHTMTERKGKAEVIDAARQSPRRRALPRQKCSPTLRCCLI